MYICVWNIFKFYTQTSHYIGECDTAYIHIHIKVWEVHNTHKLVLVSEHNEYILKIIESWLGHWGELHKFNGTLCWNLTKQNEYVRFEMIF